MSDANSDASAARPNALLGETSPYLRQHATNPVDWLPWGPEALERARREDKPILLSIGYSACHWCHVMAHESFEDPDTARVMNALFVNVKVDREERPDLDRVYQLAHQLLTQRAGGWPLTMFLSPDDHVAFFGGTYFPPRPRHGMPAFRDVLERVSAYWRTNRDAVRAQNAQLLGAFDAVEPKAPQPDVEISPAPLDGARETLERMFDGEYGGFGPAPKFPHPGYADRLLRHWHAGATTDEPDLTALYMATLTLTRMAEGGLYDQVGGGFARYSTDAYWMIPHFEKMLYDNAALLALYAQAWRATGDPLFRRTAKGTADWLLREMRAPEGGFRSSLDADSDGHEGRYYVWDRATVEQLLAPEAYRAVARRYGLDQPPNFEGTHWQFHAHVGLEALATELGTSADALQATLDSALAVLADARAHRVRPALDDKILTSWNGLAIRALAIAARALDRPDLADAATHAVDFLRAHAWRDGRLTATWKDGRAHVPGFLDDYAFLADGLLELVQARWRASDLEFARELAEAMLAHFEDPAGGCYFTADDAEQLIHRGKSYADEALPSGNGVAARVLGRLGMLLGEPRYLEAAERTVRAAWDGLSRYPHAHPSMLDALEEIVAPIETVVIRGTQADVSAWARELASLYAPRRIVLAIPDGATVPPGLADKRSADRTIAYVCEGTTCAAPVQSLALLVRRLRDGVVPAAPEAGSH
jgi:uncharacterized protein YyaL (SSP411 family)